MHESTIIQMQPGILRRGGGTHASDEESGPPGSDLWEERKRKKKEKKQRKERRERSRKRGRKGRISRKGSRSLKSGESAS